MKYFPAILFLIISIHAFGQDKVEKEYRIKESDVPEKSLNFINKTYDVSTKAKWYLEESEKGKSYEAKFKWKGKRHSVEFFENGELEDIEIQVKPDDVSKSVMSQLEKELDAYFSKFKIRKIQIQYFASESVLSQAIQTNSFQKAEKKYELIVEGKKENQLNLWEVLCDANGYLLSQRRIIEKPTNNLDF